MSDVSLSKAVRSNLLSLQSTASMMSKTQERLATGNKVNSALDNPTNFFTASALNSRASDMGNLIDSMASGIKTIEAANNGLTSITKTVESMQSTLRQARQDKSFQSATLEVTNASTISVNGGQYSADTSISLQTQTPGTAASVGSTGAYAGVTPDNTTAGEGIGARQVITLDAAPTGDVIKVAGKNITLTGATATTAAADINTALSADPALVGKYKASVGTGANAGKLVIESNDPFAAAPAVEFGAGVAVATKGTTTINYDASTVGSVTAGGQSITTGTSFDEFVTGLQSKAKDGGYTVAADAATQTITLTNVAYGATSPTVAGVPTTAAGSTNSNVFSITTGAVAGNTIAIDGQTLTFATGGTAAQSATELKSLIENNATLAAKYSVSDNAAGQLTVTSKNKAVGATFGTPTVSGAVVAGASTFTAGTATVNGQTAVAGSLNGAHMETVAAATDDVTVTYGDKSANLKVLGMVKASGLATAAETAKYQADTVSSINDQLKAQGLESLQASFDSSGKLSITSKSTEAKTLAISGADANAIFGGSTVSTGKEAVSGYNSTGTVDKFVEEINKSQAGKLRASNDNGKLRIENLSTAELTVSHDADGAGVGSPVTSKIAGNSVRENLSKQFNELRDQLDKLSDDASFNGINLLRGDELTLTFNESGSSTIKIQNKDAKGNATATTAQNLDITSLSGEDLDTDAGIDKLLGKLSTGLNTLRSQASSFGSNLSSVQNRQDFTKNMINTLQTGAANLTLADTNEEAANLLALQTRQQLASSALSMASQADQAVLRLF